MKHKETIAPVWWLERPHALDTTPAAAKPTFPESAVMEEYLKREYDTFMSFRDYKIRRTLVINIDEA